MELLQERIISGLPDHNFSKNSSSKEIYVLAHVRLFCVVICVGLDFAKKMKLTCCMTQDVIVSKVKLDGQVKRIVG